MLSPEVWEFNPPSNSLQIKTNVKDNSVTDKCIHSHYFNHLVSVALPDTPSPPTSVEESLCFDSDYYKIHDLDVSQLLHENFIKGFVKQGDVTLITIGTHLDVHNCVALTPTGHLVLSLRREVYQELGLEGTSTFTKEKEPQKYTVTIDLTAEYFVPGKSNYENAYKAIKERLATNFTVAVAWDPRDAKVCPSSIAAYFAQRGFKVSLCHPKKALNLCYGIAVPSLESVQTESDVEDFLEWLGALSIGVSLDQPPDTYLSSYQSSLKEKDSSCVAVLTWSGFFTRKQISHLLKELSDVIDERKTVPWISMHVQGFEDSPVSWGLKEHRYYTDGDNSYTVILKPNGSKILASNLSNQRLLK